MSTMTMGAGWELPRAQAPLRLTRRGRCLLTGLALLLLVVVAVLATGGPVVGVGGVPGAAGGGAAATAGTDLGAVTAAAGAERVTVRPGETLWQIAHRVAPGTDPRETVAQILELNGLQTSEVQAGTALQLP